MSFTSPTGIMTAARNKLDAPKREKTWSINSKCEKIARKRGVGELQRRLGCYSRKSKIAENSFKKGLNMMQNIVKRNHSQNLFPKFSNFILHIKSNPPNFVWCLLMCS